MGQGSISKEKKGLVLGQDVFFLGGKERKGFIMQIASSSWAWARGWGGVWRVKEKAQVTGDFFGAEQKIPGWLIKIPFLMIFQFTWLDFFFFNSLE